MTMWTWTSDIDFENAASARGKSPHYSIHNDFNQNCHDIFCPTFDSNLRTSSSFVGLERDCWLQTLATRQTTSLTVLSLLHSFVLLTIEFLRISFMTSSSDPFAWLGLLKWSLSYSDGTRPSDESMTPMGPEDKSFLEKVMKEGIIDENERMKTILKIVTTQMEAWRTATYTDEEAGEIVDFLQELRDIVEQIDYARAFAAMKGLVFLLGCVQEKDLMPQSIRIMSLGIISTMCQHNPPVQKELLELGALRILSDLFFETNASDARADDARGALRASIIQAISASVRSHDLAESVFCQLEQAPRLIAAGLGVNGDTNNNSSEFSSSTLEEIQIPFSVRKRTLFFLRAFITSDTSTRQRFHRFASCIIYSVDSSLLVPPSASNDRDGDVSELVELVLATIEQILVQRVSVDAILSRKEPLVAAAIQRISFIRKMTNSDDRKFAQVELEYWERLVTLLARATPDAEEQLVEVR